MDVREASPVEAASWSDGWTSRLGDWWGNCDGPDVWPDVQVDSKRAQFDGASTSSVQALTDGAEVVGYLALAREGSIGVLIDLWIAPDRRQRSYGSTALAWAQDWARDWATEFWTFTNPADPATAALVAEFPLRAQWMVKCLSPELALPDGVQGRPMTDDEFLAWLDASTDGYADQVADSGSMPRSEAKSAAEAQFAELLPDGVRTPGHSFWTVRAGAQPVGTNWLQHGRQPGLSFVYAVEVGAGHRGKGYGRAAMVVGEQASIDAGDTHLALNVFGHNTTAIKLYERMGYGTVEHRRSVQF